LSTAITGVLILISKGQRSSLLDVRNLENNIASKHDLHALDVRHRKSRLLVGLQNK